MRPRAGTSSAGKPGRSGWSAIADPEAELVLAALGGEKARCVEVAAGLGAARRGPVRAGHRPARPGRRDRGQLGRRRRGRAGRARRLGLDLHRAAARRPRARADAAGQPAPTAARAGPARAGPAGSRPGPAAQERHAVAARAGVRIPGQADRAGRRGARGPAGRPGRAEARSGRRWSPRSPPGWRRWPRNGSASTPDQVVVTLHRGPGMGIGRADRPGRAAAAAGQPAGRLAGPGVGGRPGPDRAAPGRRGGSGRAGPTRGSWPCARRAPNRCRLTCTPTATGPASGGLDVRPTAADAPHWEI